MLAKFIDFTDQGRLALPEELAETVALTVATLTCNDCERYQHEQLAVRMGLATAWIQAIERLHPRAQELSAGQGSTCLDADDRPRRTIQPQTRTEMRLSRRRGHG